MASSNSNNKSPEKDNDKAFQSGFLPWENASEHMLYMLAHPAKYTTGNSPAVQSPNYDNYNSTLRGMKNLDLSASTKPADSGWLEVKDLILPAWQPVTPNSLNLSAIDPHYARPPVYLLFTNNIFVPTTNDFYATAVAPWLEALARGGTFTQQLFAIRQHGHAHGPSAGAACLNCSCNQTVCVDEGEAGAACVACSGRKDQLCGRFFVREPGRVEIRVVPLPKSRRGDALWSDKWFWVVE
jgi:hypothetical protein